MLQTLKISDILEYGYSVWIHDVTQDIGHLIQELTSFEERMKRRCLEATNTRYVRKVMRLIRENSFN